jgi:hypothetical protein
VRNGLVKQALFRGQELIDHDAAVVVNDSPAHAAVVIFAVEAGASAREFDAARDEVVVVIFVMFAVGQPPARSGLTLEAAVYVHASPLLAK